MMAENIEMQFFLRVIMELVGWEVPLVQFGLEAVQRKFPSWDLLSGLFLYREDQDGPMQQV